MKGLFQRLRRRPSPPPLYAGPFASWPEAQRRSTGYDAPVILEKTRAALAQVRDGKAVYERDSVLFDRIDYSWGLLAGLLRAAGEGGNRLTVLDFGGALGSSYYQCRGFLSHLEELRWWIVEQEAHVACGRREFEDGRLRFATDPAEALRPGPAQVLLLSSVLPYLEHPYRTLSSLLELDIPYLIVDRTAFFDQPGDDILSVQNVPPSIYRASYPAWHFNWPRFARFIENTHDILGTFADVHDREVHRIGSATIRLGGLVARRKAAPPRD